MIGLIVGAFSGFFGIGGGFLIVPGIMLGSGMPILNAIGSSLLSVGTFGLTTAVNYAFSGLIDWKIAALFIVGGLVGGFFGMRAAMHLAENRRMLTYIFAGVIFAVAIYMLVRTGLPLWLAISWLETLSSRYSENDHGKFRHHSLSALPYAQPRAVRTARRRRQMRPLPPATCSPGIRSISIRRISIATPARPICRCWSISGRPGADHAAPWRRCLKPPQKNSSRGCASPRSIPTPRGTRRALSDPGDTDHDPFARRPRNRAPFRRHAGRRAARLDRPASRRVIC